ERMKDGGVSSKPARHSITARLSDQSRSHTLLPPAGMIAPAIVPIQPGQRRAPHIGEGCPHLAVASPAALAQENRLTLTMVRQRGAVPLFSISEINTLRVKQCLTSLAA